MADSVTISLLPVSLALVHIPRNRLHSLSHPILKHILHPTPTFLNLTANQIELSLFVDYVHVHDFESIAQNDPHSNQSNPVEISHEPWSVLQIDSHSDQLDNAGARVNELSAPLAAAGISILYQSSYMSDYIFVKQSRLRQALSLFEKTGFRLYTSNTLPSPTLSPIPPDPITDFPSGSSSPTILTRAQPATFPPTPPSTFVPYPIPSGGERTKSHSPTAGEVRILHPDLACVGLSDELGVDHWGLKIVKLVAFPELIPSSDTTRRGNGTFFFPPSGRGQEHVSPRDGLSARLLETQENENEDDGYFSHSPPSLTTMSPSADSSRLSPGREPRNPTAAPPPFIATDVPKSTMEDPPSESLGIPFFSFTRTQEGSSLTADVNTLAALFPPEERHLLICCADLGLCFHLNKGCECDGDDEGHDMWGMHADEEDDYCGSKISIGALKCLQIDLRRFGLDKHGLVNKFSRILERNGINHMYSSTFKTANLLVDKRHAIKAQTLLRGC